MSTPADITFILRNGGVAGTEQLLAIDPHYPMPVGLLFFRRVGNATAEILWIYVVPYLRRQGIARQMLKELVKLCTSNQLRVVMTQQGSKDGGLALLKALAFTQNPVTKDWTLPVLAMVNTPLNQSPQPAEDAS